MGHRWGYKQTYNWMAASCKEQSTVTICCWVASPCLNLIDGIWLVNCLSPNGFVWKLTGNWNTHWWIIVFLIKVATKYTYIYIYCILLYTHYHGYMWGTGAPGQSENLCAVHVLRLVGAFFLYIDVISVPGEWHGFPCICTYIITIYTVYAHIYY